jgi:hypothetical protein
MTTDPAVNLHRKPMIIPILLFLLVAGCGSDPPPPAGPPAPEPAAASEPAHPLKAKIVAGTIHRDRDTREDIERTADTAIEPGSGDALSLRVTKSRYRLDVFRNGDLLKVYPVALGGCPEGHKTRQGDERTPEGEYLLIPHHPSPSFGGCFYICYPNHLDAQNAKSEGRIDESTLNSIKNSLNTGKMPPHNTVLGGLILLHGTKQRWIPGLTTNNWTLGCIAMENDDLLELLAAWSADDRPTIEIRP